jgi:hypothetical protein
MVTRGQPPGEEEAIVALTLLENDITRGEYILLDFHRDFTEKCTHSNPFVFARQPGSASRLCRH